MPASAYDESEYTSESMKHITEGTKAILVASHCVSQHVALPNCLDIWGHKDHLATRMRLSLNGPNPGLFSSIIHRYLIRVCLALSALLVSISALAVLS